MSILVLVNQVLVLEGLIIVFVGPVLEKSLMLLID